MYESLGRCHLGRPAPGPQLGARVPQAAQAEVSDGELGLAFVEQDVLEFDVSVNDLLVVEVADPGYDLPEEGPGKLLAELVVVLVPDHVAEVAAGIEVQDQTVEVAGRNNLIMTEDC